MSGPDKSCTVDEMVSELRSGMTIGVGGWGSRRKPMSLIRAILRSALTALTIVAYGGPDVGLMCRSGKASKVSAGFVSLDSIPLEPHYRAARQSGSVEAVELDEGMYLCGIQAAAWRLPFLPTRAGLGSDVPRVLTDIRTVTSPYPDPETGEHEELIAAPAIPLDVALVHQHRADVSGNAVWLGEDQYLDDILVRAAERAFVSCERIVPTEELGAGTDVTHRSISRLDVTGVVESPGGAHFTECLPDYGRDGAFQRLYAGTARSDEAWDEFSARFLQVDDETYRARVRELADAVERGEGK